MCDHVPSIPVRFDTGIPETDMPNVPLLFGKRGQRVKAVITSDCLTSCMTHYIAGRTRPCYSPIAPCRGCQAGWQRIWKGFLGAYCWFTKQPAIIMLGIGSVRPHRRRLSGDGTPIRGCLLTLEHEGERADGAVRLTIEDHPVAGRVPPPLDVEGHLKSMWARWAALVPPDDEDRWEMIPMPGA